MRLQGKPVDSPSVSYVGSPEGGLVGSESSPVSTLVMDSESNPTISVEQPPGGVLKGLSEADPSALLSLPTGYGAVGSPGPPGPPGPPGADGAPGPAGAVINRVFFMDDYGADPTGDVESNQALIDCYEAMGDEPGIIMFGVGNYRLYTGLNSGTGRVLKPLQSVQGQGSGLTKIDYRGPGAFLEFRNPDFDATSTQAAGGVHGLNIVGWFSGESNSYGIRYGDIWRMRITDVEISGFNRPGCIGLYGDNHYRWSERAWIECSVSQCTQCVVFESNTGDLGFPTGSFDYSFYWLSVIAAPSQDGVVIRSGSPGSIVEFVGVDMTIVANCQNGDGNTGTLFTVGVGDDDGAKFSGHLNIYAETSGDQTKLGHFDLSQGDTWATQATVNAHGSINLMGNNSFRAGTATSTHFGFAGSLKHSPSLGNTGTVQAFATNRHLPGARGSWGLEADGNTYTLYAESGSIFVLDPPDGRPIRLQLNIGGMTVGASDKFGSTMLEVWIRQPLTGPPLTLAPDQFPGTWITSGYEFQWADGQEPVLSTAPGAWDLIRLQSDNFNRWTAEHVTAKTDVINVKQYGAKGNGSTNDTAAINTAIAALKPGGVLYFPQGRYMTDGGHVIATPSVKIQGTSGRAQTYNSSAQLFLRNGANTDMLTIAAPQVTIRDLVLHGQYVGQTLGSSRGLVFSPTAVTNYFLLDAVWVTSFNGDGIVFDGSGGTTSGTVVNCESRVNIGYGMQFNGNATDLLVDNCYIDQNALSGVHINASDISFTSCHIWGNGVGVAYDYLLAQGETAIHTDGVTLASSAGCRFVNCNVESNHNGAGFRFFTGANFGHIIDACDIWGNGLQGIYAYQASKCVVSNSTIHYNGWKSRPDHNSAGITIDSCSEWVISGNQFYAKFSYGAPVNQTYGFYEFGPDNTNIYFRNNMCLDDQHIDGGMFLGPGTSLDVVQVSPPATASSPGKAGQVAFDTNYTYCCIADNTWKRSPLSTW